MANHKEDICNDLILTYKSLISVRSNMGKIISHPFFTDEETPERTLPGVLISLEGILSLIYPIYGKIVTVDFLWDKYKELFIQMLEIIIEEFRFVIYELKSKDGTLFFDGKPYYEPKLSNTLLRANEHFTESVALSISCAVYLRYFIQLIDKSDFSEEIKKKIQEIFIDLNQKYNSFNSIYTEDIKNIEEVKYDFYRQNNNIKDFDSLNNECENIVFTGLKILINGQAKDGVGWGWSTGVKQTDLYYTYLVVEALSDIGDLIQGEDVKNLKIPKDNSFLLKKRKEFEKLWNDVKQIRKEIKFFIIENFIHDIGIPLSKEKLKGKVFDQIHHEYNRIYYNLYIYVILILLNADEDENIKKRMLERYSELKEFYYQLEQVPDPTDKSLDKLYQDNPDISTFKNNLDLRNYNEYEDEIKQNKNKYFVEDPGYYQLFLRVDGLLNYYVNKTFSGLNFTKDLYDRITHVRTKSSFKWENVWDEGGFLISLTQRSLEAIVDYHDLLEKGFNPDYDKKEIVSYDRNNDIPVNLNKDSQKQLFVQIDKKINQDFEKLIEKSNFLKKIKNDLSKEMKEIIKSEVSNYIKDNKDKISEILQDEVVKHIKIPGVILLNLIKFVISGADIETNESELMIDTVWEYISENTKNEKEMFDKLKNYLNKYFKNKNKDYVLTSDMKNKEILKQFIKAFSENSIS